MITLKIIGKRLNQSRCNNNLSQLDLSNLLIENGLELNEKMIDEVENGLKYLNAFDIKLMCLVLHVEPEEIVLEDADDLDLVNKFRVQYNLSEDALEELEEIQDFIKSLLAQKKLCRDLCVTSTS